MIVYCPNCGATFVLEIPVDDYDELCCEYCDWHGYAGDADQDN